MVRVCLVEQRQDGGVDAHRFAGTGGAGHQQVRHLGQVGHHRIAGDVLAESNGQARDTVVVDLGAEDLGQAHDLPLGVGKLQAHVILARDGFDHPDRGQRQRARQVACQADDLAALDADRRFDFIARDDRARIGGDDLDLDTEVGEFFLDQAAGEFQGFDAYRLLLHRRLVEQRQRRQIGVRQIGEQDDLALLFGALRFRYADDLRFDPHRRGFDDPGALVHDHYLPLDRGFHADLAILTRDVKTAQGEQTLLDPATDTLRDVQPRHMEEQAEAEPEQQQQEQRAAGETERLLRRPADDFAQHAAGCARQLRLGRVHAQEFDTDTAQEQQRKASGADDGFVAVLGRCIGIGL